MGTRLPEIDVKVDIVFEVGSWHVLQVRPYPDSPRDTLELHAPTTVSKDYFGPISLVMTKAQALAVAKALTVAAQYLEDTK